MQNLRFTILLAFTCILTACTSTKNIVYFNNLSDSVISKEVQDLESPIVPNDILNITIASLNPEAAALFNMNGKGAETGGSSGNALGQSSGYLVSKKGAIQLPLLGDIQAAGMTKEELRSYLVQQLTTRKLLVDPIVTIRLANFHVTVLGEVAHPTVLPVSNERINILEAIGLAGDLTINGRRENVLLIREEGGKKITRRVNLTSSDILTSPYYNLKSNDVVYVEPNKAKIGSASESRQILPLILSGVSVLALLVNLVIN